MWDVANAGLLHGHPFVKVLALVIAGCDIHIVTDDRQGGVVALALSDAGAHLLCLVCKAVFSQGAGSNAHKVEDIAVLPDEGTVGLAVTLLGRLVPGKTAKTVFYIVAEPGTAEVVVGTDAPQSELAHIDFGPILQREHETGQALIFEGVGFLKPESVFQDFFLGEDAVDSLHPFGEVTAAALQDEGLLILHMPQITGCNAFDDHKCIPSSIVSSVSSSSAQTYSVPSSFSFRQWSAGVVPMILQA